MLFGVGVRRTLQATVVAAGGAWAYRRYTDITTPPLTDPFNLDRRFVQTHREHFARAMSEIEDGRKVSHWSWYVTVCVHACTRTLNSDPWLTAQVVMHMNSWTSQWYSEEHGEDSSPWSRRDLSWPVVGTVCIIVRLSSIKHLASEQAQS